MRRYWHPVYLSRELESGRAKPLRVMGENFAIYRSETGVPRITAERCPHRGAGLSLGTVEDDCLRCRYHGWKFAPSGECVDQPIERKSFAHKVRIDTYPCEDYLGLVWMYLGEGEPPPMPRWRRLEGDLPRFAVSDFRRFNYFHDLENVIDDAHQRHVHRDSIYQDSEYADEMPLLTAHETSYGIEHNSTFSNGDKRALLYIAPNCVYFRTSASRLRGCDGLLWQVPVDDFHHRIFFVVTAVEDEAQRLLGAMRDRLKSNGPAKPQTPAHEIIDSIVSGRMRFEDIEPRSDRLFIEDGAVLTSQGVIPDRSLDRLGASDAAVSLLRKIWSREMRALDLGEPLREYSWPDDVRPT
ncbi:Rieske 2Fe-2S domain-containing protein [Enhygromyxa salina]|nr:Rieske 2Fe-2S domain-containing protein [Enhygromyxa salina]